MKRKQGDRKRFHFSTGTLRTQQIMTGSPPYHLLGWQSSSPQGSNNWKILVLIFIWTQMKSKGEFVRLEGHSLICGSQNQIKNFHRSCGSGLKHLQTPNWLIVGKDLLHWLLAGTAVVYENYFKKWLKNRATAALVRCKTVYFLCSERELPTRILHYL